MNHMTAPKAAKAPSKPVEDSTDVEVRANMLCTYGGGRKRKGEVFTVNLGDPDRKFFLEELPHWMDRVTPELLDKVKEMEKAEEVWAKQKTATTMSDITRGRAGKPLS